MRGKGWLGGVLMLMLVVVAATAAAGTPEQKLMAMRAALVGNDLPGLVHLAVAPPEVERERRQQARKSQGAPDPELLAWRRKEFEESFGRLLGDDAVAALLAEARPRITEVRGMFLLGSGAFFLEAARHVREDSTLSPEERNQWLALLHAVQLYLLRTDVFDEGRLTRALEAVTRAARASGIRSYDDMHRMDMDQALARFQVFFPAGKRALAAYDLDVDKILRSARFRTVSQDLERATVRVRIEVLDVPVDFPVELHAWQSDWYLTGVPAAEPTAEFLPEPEAVPEPAAAELVLDAVPVAPAGHQGPAVVEDGKVEVTIHRPVRRVPAAAEPTCAGCPEAQSNAESD